MVYKLLVVILALLVLDTSTQSLNRFQDLYKYEFRKHHGKRQDNVYTIPEGTNPPTCIYNEDKTCNDPTRKPLTGPNLNDLISKIKNPKIKKAGPKLDLMNLLYTIPREDISEFVIFVPEEFEDDENSE